MSMNNTPDSPAKTPDDCTDQGGNYWTLFIPGIWKVLHAVLERRRYDQRDGGTGIASPACSSCASDLRCSVISQIAFRKPTDKRQIADHPAERPPYAGGAWMTGAAASRMARRSPVSGGEMRRGGVFSPFGLFPSPRGPPPRGPPPVGAAPPPAP